MVPCHSAAPVKPVSDADELVAAANAVFGVLELIAETPCSEETAQNVFEATHAAHMRLRDLGLTRKDLLGPGFQRRQTQALGDALGPDSAIVVKIASRSADRST
jgi:hypothetical protein